MGKKNQRMAGRLTAVGAEVAEATERAGTSTLLRAAPADDLFVLDVPKKKRKRVVGAGEEAAAAAHQGGKRRKDEGGGALTTPQLVAAALDAVAVASRVRVMVAKPKRTIPLTRDQKRVLDETTARLAAAAPNAEAERELLHLLSTGTHKTTSRGGGYTLEDVWAGGGGPAVARRTTSKPAVRGSLSSVPGPGASYNPSLEAHQAAVAAAQEEEEAEEARRALLMARTMGADRKAASVPGARLGAGRALIAKHALGGSAAALLPLHASGRDDGGAPDDPDWDAEAEEALQAYMATLDERDPDEEGDEGGDVEMAGGDPSSSSSAAAAPPRTRAEMIEAKKRHFYSLAAERRAARRATGTVEEALAAVQAEEAARGAKRAERGAASAALQARIKAGTALPYVPRKREPGITMTPIPLSSELTGSLRTMKPLGAGAVVLDAMAGLVARGDTAARRVAHAPMREDLATGALLPVPLGTLRRTKGIGHPYKDLEFPRRRQFEPAAAAAKEAEEARHRVKVKKSAEDAARGEARKAARLEAARALGLEQ